MAIIEVHKIHVLETYEIRNASIAISLFSEMTLELSKSYTEKLKKYHQGLRGPRGSLQKIMADSLKTFTEQGIPHKKQEEWIYTNLDKFLTENLEVTICFMDEKPISVELPKNLECIIDSTEAVVKGQTASSSYKPAKLKNGISVMVPPFIQPGEKIIIDSRNLEYVKKVN